MKSEENKDILNLVKDLLKYKKLSILLKVIISKQLISIFNL
jgi:hypothetical protein